MKTKGNNQAGRVILAVAPRLLREMLTRVIRRSPHLQLAAQLADSQGLLALLERTDAQWVILSLASDGSIPLLAEDLLAAHPAVNVLAMASDASQVKVMWKEPCQAELATDPDGKPVELKWTEPHRKSLPDLSLNQLIQVLHGGRYVDS